MRTQDIDTRRVTRTRRPIGRHRFFLPGVLASAVALAMAGVYLGTPDQAMATLPATGSAQTASFAGAPGFAAIAERVTPAVVNIAVTQDGAATVRPRIDIPEVPEGSNLGELFRRYFHQELPVPEGFEVPHHMQGEGSGFIIDPEGHIVTNDHVVRNATQVAVVMNDGTRYEARVVGRDSKTDLALLKIDAGKPLPFVKFGGSEQARVGDWVLAVGNPFGLGGSVSAGIISARGRDIHSGPYDDYIQIDAPINRGNSGGPLFDASGRVIGVNTAIYSPSGGNVGIGFAIPASTAQKVVAELKGHGRVERGWLGVQIQSVTDGIAAALGRDNRRGALVADVMADGPAAGAGLRAGDLIVSFDGKSVSDVKDLPKMVADVPPGTEVAITVLRNGVEKKLNLVVSEMPGEDSMAAAPEPRAKDAEPRLGLYLAPLTPDARQAQGLGADAQGVLVAGVQKGSAAEAAGIHAGSLITMVGQQMVNSPDEAVGRVREAISKGNGSVLLRVEQNGETRFIALKPTA